MGRGWRSGLTGSPPAPRSSPPRDDRFRARASTFAAFELNFLKMPPVARALLARSLKRPCIVRLARADSIHHEARALSEMTDQIPRAALVTGAARRIGRAIALALHRGGLCGRHPGEPLGRGSGKPARRDRARRRARRRGARRPCRSRGGGRTVVPAAAGRDRAADLAGQQRVDVRAGRDRRARRRALRPAVRRQPARAAVSRRGLRRAGAGQCECLDRQHPRSARVQAHAALRLLHAGEKRAACGDAHAGAGARAQRARQRGRAGSDHRERAAAARRTSPARRRRFRSATGRARRRSPRRSSISPARAASPA